MRCKKCISYLNAYVDTELPDEQRRDVALHLKTCEDCRDQLERVRHLNNLLDDRLPVPPVPKGFSARVMAEARRRLPGTKPERAFQPYLQPVRWFTELSAAMRFAACITIMLAFIVGLSLDGGQSTEVNQVNAQDKYTYGLEWFNQVPPGSVAETYLSMSSVPITEGDQK